MAGWFQGQGLRHQDLPALKERTRFFKQAGIAQAFCIAQNRPNAEPGHRHQGIIEHHIHHGRGQDQRDGRGIGGDLLGAAAVAGRLLLMMYFYSTCATVVILSANMSQKLFNIPPTCVHSDFQLTLCF